MGGSRAETTEGLIRAQLGRPPSRKPLSLDVDNLNVLPQGMPEDVELLLSPGTPSSRHLDELPLQSPILRKEAARNEERRRTSCQLLCAIGMALLLLSTLLAALFFLVTFRGDQTWMAALRLNELQLLGSLQSCHVAPEEAILNLLQHDGNGGLAKRLAFTRSSIAAQLEAGYRFLHIEVFYDPKGGRFLNRDVLRKLGRPTASHNARLLDPGYKVLHIPDVDFNSTCFHLQDCLAEVKQFSSNSRGHLPIVINLDLVTTLPNFRGVNVQQPLPITSQSLLDLEAEVAAVFPRQRILAPDDIRGASPSLLNAAVESKKWPTLAETAGKVLFLLTPNEAIDEYRAISEGLQGRLLFTAQSVASIEEVNNLPDQIFLSVETVDNLPKDLVKKGHIVIFPVLSLAAENGHFMWDKAQSSGSQFIPVHDVWDDNENLGKDVYDESTAPLFVRPGRFVQARCNILLGPTKCKGSGILLEPIL